MSDPALRSLERAFAAGEEGARVPLAAARLRHGDAGAALDLLASPAVLPAEAARVHEEAWRRALSGLAPAGDTAVGIDPDAAFVGWCGAAPRVDRYAVVGGHLLEVEPMREVHLPAGARPVFVATTAHAVYARLDQVAVRYEPPREAGGEWPVTPLALRQADAGFQPSPDGRLALTGELGVQVLASLPDGDIVRLLGLNTARDVCWTRRRLAWWSQGKVFVSGFDAGPPAVIDVARALKAATPVVTDALPVRPALFQLLGDGRLLLGPPLVVVDLETRDVRVPADGRHPKLEGPARLSRDGEAVLAFVRGAPVRIALQGGPTPERLRRGESPATTDRAWHPFADVAAFAVSGGAAEVRGCDGEPLVTLPRDLRPLAWTPDGRGLLVMRRTGPRGGVELWRAGGALA